MQPHRLPIAGRRPEQAAGADLVNLSINGGRAGDWPGRDEPVSKVKAGDSGRVATLKVEV